MTTMLNGRLAQFWADLTDDEHGELSKALSARFKDQMKARGYGLYRNAEVGHLEDVALAADQLLGTLKGLSLPANARAAVRVFEEATE